MNLLRFFVGMISGTLLVIALLVALGAAVSLAVPVFFFAVAVLFVFFAAKLLS